MCFHGLGMTIESVDLVGCSASNFADSANPVLASREPKLMSSLVYGILLHLSSSLGSRWSNVRQSTVFTSIYPPSAM